MTDVMEEVMNGDGDLDNDAADKCSEQQEEYHQDKDDIDGVMETDSSAFMDSSSLPQADNILEEQDDDDEEALQQSNNPDTTQDATDDGETGGMGDESTVEGTDGDVSTEDHIVKVELDGESMSQQEENDEDEEDEQNSAEESEPILLNQTSGASAENAPNGDANSGEENSSDDRSLLTGLLGQKDASSQALQKSSQQTRTFSVSDGNAIAKELEDQVGKLNQLLVLKEKEWSAILRLKKHFEYALDQVKCTQRIAKVQDGLNGPLSSTDIKVCMSLIVSEKEALTTAERQIEESIESTETENESLQSIFPFRSQTIVGSGLSSNRGDNLTASAALQKLCERKRKAMDDLTPGRTSRLRIIDVQSNAPQMQSKVIGNGRKGAIVDVQSIIQSHRNLTSDTKNLDKQKSTKKNTSFSPLPMTPDRQYCKTLGDLLVLAAEADTKKETPAAPPVPSNPVTQLSRSITPKPKNGKAPRQVGNNSLLANPTPSSSGALAKMLSPSTHSSIGSNRNSNEVSTNSHKFTSKLPNAEANLSLANLLATSKIDTKINVSKVKKQERNARDDDASIVPSQQEAVPICQGCNLSRAQFVCAGCANQWYCSRECQVAAWDEHSEICSG